MYDLVLRGGTVVSPVPVRADVWIRDGQIVGVGPDLVPNGEVIDCRGLHLLPGVIDTQVHFREPGLEHKEDIESGTRSAVMGGVTTIFEMPNTNPTTTTENALRDKLRRASGRAWCDYAFFVGASPENVTELRRLEQLPGTPGIKIFMGSSTGSLLVDDENVLRRVLEEGARPCPVHAEDEARLRERKSLLSAEPHPCEHPFLRDAEAAYIATRKLIRLCRETGRPVHVLHVSTADELVMIADAKREGLPVTCEVTPQHLWFSAPDCYERLGTLAQMNPPIRDESHRQAIWQAFRGGLFDVIGSDHAPHTLEEKLLPYPASPSGMPGVQTLLPAMLTFVAQGLIPLEYVVAKTSMAPAALYGVWRKGRIEPGYDADIAVVDLRRRWTFERSMVESKCAWSPYEGYELTGKVRHTLLRGQFVVRDEHLVGSPLGSPASFEWKQSVRPDEDAPPDGGARVPRRPVPPTLETAKTAEFPSG